MGVSPEWHALAAATTLMNGLTLGLIAWREHHRALWFWAGAWLAWAVAVVPLSLLAVKPSAPLSAVACGLLWVVSALCFLRGAYAFAGRRMPRAWFGVASACAVLALALGVGPAGATGMIPLVLFQSAGLLATGVLLFRSARRGAGRWLCGIALVTLALHLLDAPILSEHPGLMPWGFVAATALEVLAALGMLALYYEQARFELLEAQRVLAESRRIEALGRVAGSVAHDFNNLLTVLRGNLDFVRRDQHLGAQALECLHSMDQAISQTSRLTAQLLAFGRPAAARPSAIDVREVVEGTLTLLAKVMPENVRLVFDSADHDYVSATDRALVEQVVLNLVTNARDAISARGTVGVSLDRLEVPEPRIVLRVVDDGCGMDEGLVKRAFEPFFTTKPAGRGTGLGLATVQRAVTELGGQVSVESWPGKGSRFEVVLPLATGTATA